MREPLFAEIDFWTHASKSLSVLSDVYATTSTMETIGRVNRLITMWPPDDTLPAEGIAQLKSVQQKLSSGLSDIMSACDTEIKYDIQHSLELFSCMFQSC